MISSPRIEKTFNPPPPILFFEFRTLEDNKPVVDGAGIYLNYLCENGTCNSRDSRELITNRLCHSSKSLVVGQIDSVVPGLESIPERSKEMLDKSSIVPATIQEIRALQQIADSVFTCQIGLVVISSQDPLPGRFPSVDGAR